MTACTPCGVRIIIHLCVRRSEVTKFLPPMHRKKRDIVKKVIRVSDSLQNNVNPHKSSVL